MSLIELFILAVGLSMDAFAVSICKGLSLPALKPRHAAITGLYFGGFQALMPLVGYLLGTQFQQFITNVDHWIAFGLLVFIGVNMIRESRSEPEELNCQFSPAAMLPLAVATSIDALAVGVTFAFLSADGLQDPAGASGPAGILSCGVASRLVLWHNRFIILLVFLTKSVTSGRPADGIL